MSPAYQFLGEIGDNAFGATVGLGRNTLVEGATLAIFKGHTPLNGPPRRSAAARGRLDNSDFRPGVRTPPSVFATLGWAILTNVGRDRWKHSYGAANVSDSPAGFAAKGVPLAFQSEGSPSLDTPVVGLQHCRRAAVQRQARLGGIREAGARRKGATLVSVNFSRIPVTLRAYRLGCQCRGPLCRTRAELVARRFS